MKTFAIIFHYFLLIGGIAGVISGISMLDDPKDKDGTGIFAMAFGGFMLFLLTQ